MENITNRTFVKNYIRLDVIFRKRRLGGEMGAATLAVTHWWGGKQAVENRRHVWGEA
jgi:hypothetical protein